MVVLDNDLLNFIGHQDYGVSVEMGKLLDALVDSMNLALNTRKSQLPKRAQKESHFVWIGCPLHEEFEDNLVRVKFNNCLESIITQYRNMSMMMPRKGWNSANMRAFKNGNYTSEGSRMYWKAIDSAIKFWIMKGSGQLIQKGPLITSIVNKEEDSTHKNLDVDNLEAEDLIQLLAKKRRGNFQGISQNLESLDTERVYNNKRPRFDRYHWYKNCRDMDRAQGELRKKQPTPKRFKRRLNFN